MMILLDIIKVITPFVLLLILATVVILLLKLRSKSKQKLKDTRAVPNMLPIVKHLGDSMNVLIKVSKDGNLILAKNTFENIRRTINTHGDEKLKNWFSDFYQGNDSWGIENHKQKAAEMIELLKQHGIHQLEEGTVTWDENCNLRYRHIGEIANGTLCEVVSPCWIFQDEIVERGEVKAIRC